MTDRVKLAIQKAIHTQPRTVDEWIKAKVAQNGKFSDYFTVNQDGDLTSPAFKDGDAPSVIELTPEVPASKEYIQTFFKKRREDLRESEEVYTSAKRHLHSVMGAYKAGQATIADVLGANQDVHDAECKVSEKAKFPRNSNELTGTLVESDLSFQRYEARPIAERVYSVEYTTFPWKAFWMAPTNAGEIEEQGGEALVEPVQEPKQKRALTPQQRAIIAARRGASGTAGKVNV
jgi:hypothetical protein